VDLTGIPARITNVRKLATLLLLGTISVVAAGSADSAAPGRRTFATGRISVRLPPGWRMVHGWLSDVLDPIPRVAIASFPARLSRHTCVCGMPNVESFPRTGAFLFVWEYPNLPRRVLARFPRRPARFRMASERPQRYVCQGPSDEVIFREAGRAFQAELYLGPAAGPRVRARLLATLDSMQVGRAA
jgi:hypothetical protein